PRPRSASIRQPASFVPIRASWAKGRTTPVTGCSTRTAGREVPSPAPYPPAVASRAEELAPGDLLGPYRLEELLGEGAIGLVFRASGPGGEIVALKVLRAELSADHEFLRRFAHEAR